MFSQGYFTHDSQTGQRVNQYAKPAPAMVPDSNNYVQSAYRQNHIEIRAGGSADNIHVVETWGNGEWIRPYGEWERPFREGATPYGPWGNPNGPWTTPFQSWVNPYGLGKLPGYGPYPYSPMPYGPQGGGMPASYPAPYGPQGGPMPTPYSGSGPVAPPPPMPQAAP